MTKLHSLTHEFVDFVPEQLEPGTLYVSIRYKSASHLCCCGCGEKVVTPLSPTGWRLTYDGKTVSLSPSIGNWNLACRSHYWIERNRVEWAETWSRQRAASGFARDIADKQAYFAPTPIEPSLPEAGNVKRTPLLTFVRRFLKRSAK
ncbi:DUF6527 family protein [Tahibacter amnicola]|uniref:DUF6527 family protein n=1 Tax=Tahibacter amnicola TaxID=2976241 RepID=A0ABY6BCS9_9GAMM|nr:DUF6527 family protein [Tahibacter amnicola]UXI66130.1 DUF6527 family protein [Tahibacter amnicola]